MDRYILIMLGGAVGSLARYAAGTAIMNRLGVRFPLGTFVVNVSGAFLIGMLMALFTGRVGLHPNWRLALVVGFLGGYTTFSTLEWETLALVKDGARWLGLINAAGSIVVGYAAVWLGSAIVGKW